MGSATLLSDVRYTCQSSSVTKYTVSFNSNLPAGTSVTLSGAGTYNNHSNVTLTAPVPTNYKMRSFSGFCGAGTQQYDGSGTGGYAFDTAVSGTQTSYSYTLQDLTSNCSVTANYDYVPPEVNKKYTVTVSADPGGSVTLDGMTGGTVSKVVNAGATVSVSANPSAGYTFYSWSNFLSGKSQSTSILVDRDINALASFSSSSVVVGTGIGNTTYNLDIKADPVPGAGFMTRSNMSCSFDTTLASAWLS